MKKLLLKLLYIIPIPIIVISTNYCADPANLFRSAIIENNGNSYEDQIVNYIAEGYHVTNIGRYNERLFNKALIKSLSGSPEIAVFGSSKAQLIDNSFFSDELINNCVTGATTEDIFGLFQVYFSKSIMPSRIILELSPGMLNKQNSSTRWKDLKLEYDSLESILNGINFKEEPSFNFNIPSKFYELISFEYFQQSLKTIWKKGEKFEIKNNLFFEISEFEGEYSIDSLYKNLTKAGFSYSKTENESKIDFLNRVLEQIDFYNQWLKLFPNEELMEQDQNLVEDTKQEIGDLNVYLEKVILRNRKLLETTFWQYCPIVKSTSIFKSLKRENKGLTICKDGTISYPENFRNRSEKKVDYSANATASTGKLFGFENFEKIDSSKISQIEKFIDLAQRNDIEIIIYLGSFHPIIHNYIKEKSLWQVKEAEKTYKSIANKYGLKLIGSYDPFQQNLSNSDFLDGAHLKKASIKKVFEKN